MGAIYLNIVCTLGLLYIVGFATEFMRFHVGKIDRILFWLALIMLLLQVWGN